MPLLDTASDQVRGSRIAHQKTRAITMSHRKLMLNATGFLFHNSRILGIARARCEATEAIA